MYFDGSDMSYNGSVCAMIDPFQVYFNAEQLLRGFLLTIPYNDIAS